MLLGRRAMPLPIPWLTLAQALAASALMALVISTLPSIGGLPELALKAAAGLVIYGLVIVLVDAGALRSRGQQALRTLRARSAA